MLSTKHPIRYTPEHLREQPGAPVYLLKVPTIRDRLAHQRELQAEGAAWQSDEQILAALLQALDRQLDPPLAQEMRAVLERHAQAKKERAERAADAGAAAEQADQAAAAEHAEQERMFAELTQKVAELEQAMVRADPAYRRLVAERAEYMQLAPLIAAQMFLLGWENVEHRFERLNGRASDDCLMRLPQDHLLLIGWEAIRHFRPAEEQAKN